MSNTSTVTPYEPQDSGTSGLGTAAAAGAGVAAVAVAGVGAVAVAGVGAVRLARWLVQETEEDLEIRRQLAATRAREIVGTQLGTGQGSAVSSQATTIRSVPLRVRNVKTLLRTAEKMGFRRDLMVAGTDAPTLLRKATGERLAIARSQQGGLVVHTAGPADRVSTLVRQHTVDQAIEHLGGLGMLVQTSDANDGETQILARAKTESGTGGAEIRTQVHADGSLCVDVKDVRGRRCRQIVADLADAVGGEVTATDWKDAYFGRAAEPTRTRERV